MRGIHILACLAIVASTGLAPETVTADPVTATLTGIAIAADGARLAGVSLQLRDLDSGLVVESVSTDAGVFRLGGLPPGRYALRAELDGFESRHVSDLVLSAGQTASLTLRLEVATVRELVRVLGTTPRDSVEAFEIRESRARDVGEALAGLPGLVKVRKGGIANDVVVRGFQGKDVTLLIDGQRIDGACPGHMDPPAFHVDFAEVGRIEVSKGPFDVKNQGGLAAVVNIVTERPQRGRHGSANLVAGSAGTLAASATASAGGDAWAVLAGASARTADPYRDGAGVSLTARANYRADAIADVRAYGAWTGWGRLALVPRPGTTVHLSYTRQSADTILYPYLQMDALFDNADRAGGRLEVADLPGGWGALAASAYYTRVDHWMTDEYRSTALNMARSYSMATRAETGIAGGRAEVHRGGFNVGVEASRRRWNSETMLAMRKYVAQSPLPDATIDVAGGFGAYTTMLGPAWRLEAGARLDRASSDVDRSIANTALYLAYHGTDQTRVTDLLPVGYVRGTWRHERGWHLALGVGHAARLPDQQERYYALQRMGTDWVGNPRLSPSRNTGIDAELRYTRQGVDAGLAAYAYRIDDHLTIVDRPRLAAVPGVMNAFARSYENVDALVRGVEASATVPLARALFLAADVSALRGTTRGPGSAGLNLPEMPPARARVRLRFDNGRWNAVAEALGTASQNRVATTLGESRTPAFAVVNLRGGLRLRPFDVTAGIDNLLDTFYAEHLSYQRDPFRSGVRVYEPGRTVSVSLGARF